MSENQIEIDVTQWVEKARADPVSYLQRQAVEITLNAIAMTSAPGHTMALKGGILMGLAYDSPRQTADIDLSAEFLIADDVGQKIQSLLDKAFPRATTALGYSDLVLKTQSVRKQPKEFADAQAPALKLKIGFATRGGRQEGLLAEGKASMVIDVDISFNEKMQTIQILELTGGQELRAYSFNDLISEKYRAMIQQKIRKRSRRQDTYDLDLLIQQEEINDQQRLEILNSLLIKCDSRDFRPNRDSLDDPEIRERSSAEWDTMKLELGEVPDFNECFERVVAFYKELPWDKV